MVDLEAVESAASAAVQAKPGLWDLDAAGGCMIRATQPGDDDSERGDPVAITYGDAVTRFLRVCGPDVILKLVALARKSADS